MTDDDVDTADDIVWGAVADLELEQYTKREIVEKLREAADDIEGELSSDDIQGIWVRGEK